MTSIRPIVFAALALAALAARPSFAQAPTPSTSPLVQAGDELYAQRADLAKAKEARAQYEAALAAKEDEYGACWRLARVLYWIGDHAATNDAKKPLFQKGIEHAKRAVELDPNKPDGHFWLGVCYGVYGEAKGVLKSLALVKPIKAAMRRVLEIDPAYDHGGADRVLGRVYHELPGFAGGSERTSLTHLLKSVEYGPRVGLNLLYLADTYISLDRVEDARKTLETILALDPMPDLLPETAEEQAQARQRLERKPFKKK